MNPNFNLQPDPPDERDYLYKSTLFKTELPDEVDLRPLMSPVVDQGWLGSCSANAIASGLREYLMNKDGQPLTRLSRLFLYWHSRNEIGKVNEDSGAYLRDGMKIMNKIGCAPEADMPYVESKFRDKPSAQADANAAKYKLREYKRITSSADLLQALAEGYPVVLGATLYESYYDIGKDGIFQMPKPGERSIGRHAMLACGYKRINGVMHVLLRNSYGTSWGDKGYGWMPIDYIRSINVTDMWTGSAMVKSEDITFADAIKHFVDSGIFDSPDFWANFEKKYQAGQLTNADFEYVFLGFRKLAARDMNK